MKADRPLNFIIFGLGFVSERHLRVIRDIGGNLIGALDPHDSVGILDSYFPACEFFTEPERFDRWLSMLRGSGSAHEPQWAAVCSPNWLHDAHCRMAMRAGCDVICEKPVVINPRNMEQLQLAEEMLDQRVYVVHQLRYHPDMIRLWRMEGENTRERRRRADVVLTYCSPRGPWYEHSWKGDESRSGGILMNLGIHFLDALLWIYGRGYDGEVHLSTQDRMAGFLNLEHATVRWFLSTNPADCPDGTPNRSMTVDGKDAFDFSRKFGDLHKEVYETVLSGSSPPVTLADALPAIALAANLRGMSPGGLHSQKNEHPMLEINLG